MAGPAATFFHTDLGSQDAPDLAVLRILTPVAVAADRTAARWDADQLNRLATVSRRVFVMTGRDDEQAFALACSFVVGPHNLGEPTGFAVWCAREQIAAAALDARIAKPGGTTSRPSTCRPPWPTRRTASTCPRACGRYCSPSPAWR
jgi:hypothetical protein